MTWNFRKPLVVMSPKSLLRHPLCISPVVDLHTGTQFQPVIEDKLTGAQAKKIRRVIFCSGKIYYDLVEFKEKNKIENVAIVRLEQLYPLHRPLLEEISTRYNAAEKYWVQEEPANMGAWTYIQSKLPDFKLKLISRKTSASPATGYKKLHDETQAKIVSDALTV